MRNSNVRTAAGSLIMGVATLLAAGGEPAVQAPDAQAKPVLVIRIDDIGFCHGANAAAARILKEGVCTSASVIVNTPWLDEAVAILTEHPEVSVGVHLTLNAEWREYRWGPVSPYSEVRSLVDEDGRFFSSQQKFLANHPRTEEAEREMRSQIELARRKGLPIAYLDCHMGTATCTPELRQVVEKLAAEYKLGISGYFGEIDTPSLYETAPDQKRTEAIAIVERLAAPGPHLMIVHPGSDTPEMAAMSDLNPTKAKPMAAHRQAESDVLCDPAFRSVIARRGIQLVGYRELCGQGLEKMKRPGAGGAYGSMNAPASQPVSGKP